jgi:hypothetical protein
MLIEAAPPELITVWGFRSANYHHPWAAVDPWAPGLGSLAAQPR